MSFSNQAIMYPGRVDKTPSPIAAHTIKLAPCPVVISKLYSDGMARRRGNIEE